MNMKRCVLCGVALLSAIVTSSVTNAAFVVSIGSVSVTAGGAHVFVDVNAYWNGVGTDKLLVMAPTFVITPPGGAGSSVKFTTYVDGSNGDHQFGESDYVFDGVSVDMLGPTPVPAGQVSPSGFEFSGGDGIFDPLHLTPPYVTLSDDSSQAALLYRFELEATGAPIGTELFTLDLDSLSSFFIDGAGGEELVGFISEPGIISVSAGVTAVPEPASGLIFLIGVGLWTLRSRKRAQVGHS